MSIEDEIDTAISTKFPEDITVSIRVWPWTQYAARQIESEWIFDDIADKRHTEFLRTILEDKYDIANRLIEAASDVECLASPSRYIRECKRWFIQNDNRAKN